MTLTRWERLLAASLLTACLSNLLCTSAGAAEVFTIEAEVQRINLTFSRDQLTNQVLIKVEPKQHQWGVSINHDQKYACTYQDFVLEKPDYLGTNTWRMISDMHDGHPIDLDEDERVLWMVYCATDYLHAKEGKPVITPFGNVRFDPYAQGCTLQAQWQSPQDVCPEQAKFLFDPTSLMKGMSLFSHEPPGQFSDDRNQRYADYFNGHVKGQLIATFSVLEWTDSGGVRFPAKWQLELNWHDRPGLRWAGQLKAIHRANEAFALGEIPKGAQITDKRPRSITTYINSINYTTPDGKITDLNDPRIVHLITDHRLSE